MTDLFNVFFFSSASAGYGHRVWLHRDCPAAARVFLARTSTWGGVDASDGNMVSYEIGRYSARHAIVSALVTRGMVESIDPNVVDRIARSASRWD